MIHEIDRAVLESMSPEELRRTLVQIRKLPEDMPAENLAACSREDPRDFIRDVLGERPTPAAIRHGYKNAWTPQQDDVMVSVWKNRRTAVPAGVGTGKTYIAARLANWWLHRWQPCKVITTAPTWRQVRKLLWSEIHTARDRSLTSLPGRRNDLEIRIAEDHFMLGLATRPETGDISATAFQGFHSPHVLIIFDEATGIPLEIHEAAEGIAVGPEDRWLQIGNPTDPSSRFHDDCIATREDGSKLWNVLPLDGRMHPNVVKDDPMIVPGAVSREWIAEKLEEYGSEDAPLFMAKVRGEWPSQASDALIQLAWVSQAQMRWERVRDEVLAGTYKDDHRGICASLDVAGEGTDLTVLSFMEQKGWHIPKVNGRRAFHSGRDVNEAVELCCAAILEYPEIAVLVMDDTGLGQGVSAQLRRLQREKKLPGFHKGEANKGRSLWIWPIKFGERAVEAERFDRMKDQLWWAAREALRKTDVAFPSDEVIKSWGLPKGNSPVSQITRPIYGSVNGKIVVWDKRESGLRGGSETLMERIRLLPASSPDVGHSFAMACLGWERLKPGKVVDAVTTTQEIFDRKTRKMLDGGRSRRAAGGPQMPWQRRRA